jgi:hypothetical protein
MSITSAPRSASSSASADPYDFPPLRRAEIIRALAVAATLRAAHGDRDEVIFDIASEARRRQIRDGNFEVDADFEDGAGHAWAIYPEEGGPDEAVAAAGFDPDDPEVREIIIEAELQTEEMVSVGHDDCREMTAPLERLNAPDWSIPRTDAPRSLPVIAPNIVDTSIVWRPIGHAPRVRTNHRTGGSRRTTGSGSSSSGEDPDEPSRSSLGLGSIAGAACPCLNWGIGQ